MDDPREDIAYRELIAAAEEIEQSAAGFRRNPRYDDSTVMQVQAGSLEGAAEIVRRRAHTRLIEITG